MISAKQFVEDLISHGATPEEVNQIVKNYAQKLLSLGKKALAVALIAALSLSTVACDLLENPNASATETVYVTDELGNVVTDESGNPIIANPETEEFTYPEFETELFQTLSNDELRLDFFNYFEMKKALSGFYMNRYYEEVYNIYRDDLYRGELLSYYDEDVLMANTYTTGALDNLFKSKDKSFTLELDLVNQQILKYSLVVDDAKHVLAIVATDKYTGEERILNGIVGDMFYTEYETPITLVKNKDKSTILAYLNGNSFSDFTSNILAYIPSCIITFSNVPYLSQIDGDLTTSSFVTHYSDKNDIWSHKERYAINLQIINSGMGVNSKVQSINVISLGFDVKKESVSGSIPVTMGWPLAECVVYYDQLPKIIMSELGKTIEQEIPVEPETATGAETN